MGLSHHSLKPAVTMKNDQISVLMMSFSFIIISPSTLCKCHFARNRNIVVAFLIQVLGAIFKRYSPGA